MKDHIIICGGGRMAISIAQELEKTNVDFLIIERSKDSPILEYRNKWIVIEKDALLEESLIEAGIERATGLASVLPTDADNLFVVLSARKLNHNLFIYTRIAFETTRSKMIQAGANKVISPYSFGGVQIARGFISPEVDDFLSVIMDSASYGFEMKIHKIKANDEFSHKTIRNAKFRKKGYMVIGIRYPNGKLIFAPDADFMLLEGLEILILGQGSD